MALGFTESKEDSNLCLKVEGKRLVMLLLNVDDLFLTKVARILASEFEIKDLDMMHYFLSMDVWQNLPRTREVCSRDLDEV